MSYRSVRDWGKFSKPKPASVKAIMVDLLKVNKRKCCIDRDYLQGFLILRFIRDTGAAVKSLAQAPGMSSAHVHVVVNL